MAIRILTNIRNLDEVAEREPDFEVQVSRARGWAEAIRMFVRAWRFDFILLTQRNLWAMVFVALKWVAPFHRPGIVLLDIMLSRPRGALERVKARITGLLLNRTHRIFVYYQNTRGLEKYYGMPANKFEYIPFKVNQFDTIREMGSTDEGYVFSGGKTRRDFATLFEAVRGLDCPVRVATTSDDKIARHGTFIDETAAPENVEIVRLDKRPEQFLPEMAGARLVVLPVTPEICGAGISVYFQAMALRKCVILSEGPAAEDVLTSGQAIIVPAADPAALRRAIERALEDPAYRAGFEWRGYEWATALGGEKELYERLLGRLRTLHEGPSRSSWSASEDGEPLVRDVG